MAQQTPAQVLVAEQVKVVVVEPVGLNGLFNREVVEAPELPDFTFLPATATQDAAKPEPHYHY